jgi:hypothetical protein
MFRNVLAICFAAAAASLIGALPAHALSTKECSVLYQTAKDANTLNGMKWADFRKANCAADAAAAEPAKADKPAKKKKDAAAPAADTMKAEKPAKKAKADTAAMATAPADGKLSAKECSAKYQDAKANDVLNGMKWNDFRKAMCGAGADAAAAAEPADKPKKAKKLVLTDAADTSGAVKLSAKDCSALYQSAKAADALGGMKWNDFRKDKCSGDAAAAPEPAALPAAKADAAMAPAGHLSVQDCSAKYQAAKSAGTLNGAKWNDFRKTECAADSQDAPDAIDASNDTAAPDPVEPALVSTASAPKGVKFPRSVSADYSDQSEGRARMHTCVDAYHVNKDAGTLNGLKWIQKGGGFYSLCNAKLKGL